MPNSFLSKTQLQQHNCLCQLRTQLTKTFRSKRPAVDLSLTVVFCSKKNLASGNHKLCSYSIYIILCMQLCSCDGEGYGKVD